MSAKAEKKLRRSIRKEVRESIAVQAVNSPDGLAARCERLERMCRSFKAREGRVTVALVALAVAYKKRDTIAINKFLGDTLRDYDLLAHCNQVMASRDLAMKIALDALKMGAEGGNYIRIGTNLSQVFAEAIERIKKLDPFFIYARAEDVPPEAEQVESPSEVSRA